MTFPICGKLRVMFQSPPTSIDVQKFFSYPHGPDFLALGLVLGHLSQIIHDMDNPSTALFATPAWFRYLDMSSSAAFPPVTIPGHGCGMILKHGPGKNLNHCYPADKWYIHGTYVYIYICIRCLYICIYIYTHINTYTTQNTYNIKSIYLVFFHMTRSSCSTKVRKLYQDFRIDLMDSPLSRCKKMSPMSQVSKEAWSQYLNRVFGVYKQYLETVYKQYINSIWRQYINSIWRQYIDSI